MIDRCFKLYLCDFYHQIYQKVHNNVLPNYPKFYTKDYIRNSLIVRQLN